MELSTNHFPLTAALLLPLWLAVLITDLRHRRVPVVVLAALTLVSLIYWPWPWWLIAGAVLLWPWRRFAIWIAPIALAVGVLTNEPAVAAAIAAGCVGWALGWWGGADGIVLLALALRGDWPGLIGGAAAVLIAGLALMLIRRRPMSGVLIVLPQIARLESLDTTEIPVESEMPGAAVLAVIGIVLEAARLLTN